jgi:hypothetical protein
MAGINNYNKYAVMKKIFALLILAIALVSCYDDYIKDFDRNAVYFAYQTDVRSFIVGEGMKIQLGVNLAGVMVNNKDRNVEFQIDNTLVTPAILATMQNGVTYIKTPALLVTTLLPVPASYYTLSNSSTMVIKAGQHTGVITLKADSAAFLADAATKIPTYAIPLRITSADADTILTSKNYQVVGLKYENMLFGNYLHGGVTTVKDATGTTINTIVYYTAVNQGDTKIWTLTTAAPNAVASNGYSDQTSTTKKEITLTLSGTDITVSSATGSTNTYLADGASTYNAAKLLQNRKILLNYKYVIGANTYYCQDTLTFRNRIRDGVNEWQDENPSHYTK